MKRIILTIFLISSILSLSLFASSPSADKIALIIGNSNYKISPLKNPVNDAKAMRDALKSLGFNVIYIENASKKSMKDKIREFEDKIDKNSIALVYYAGHGIQYKGQNYLIPINADIKNEDEIDEEGLSVDYVMEKLDSKKPRVSVVVLDACRDNPFVKTSRNTQRGLAVVQSAKGTLIAYATSPGSTANDGSGRNGLYTEKLLKYIKTPNLELEQVFKKTRQDVLAASNGQQNPWETSSLVGDFYFMQNSSISNVANESDEVKKLREENEKMKLAMAGKITPQELERLSKPEKTQLTQSADESTPQDMGSYIKPAMVLIHSGSFQMGSNDGIDQEIHTVNINYDFYMGKYDVTFKEYNKCVNDGACQAPNLTNATCQSDDCPVVNVSWNDAKTYTSWLSRKTGQTYRLPSEAEWEYSARAGTTTKYYWGNDFNGNYAWVKSNSGGAAHPVGQKAPNAWGLYDMSGNVWQWADDWFTNGYTSTPRDGSANSNGDQKYRVSRGGDWANDAANTRSAGRGGGSPGHRSTNIGFRLLRTQP